MKKKNNTSIRKKSVGLAIKSAVIISSLVLCTSIVSATTPELHPAIPLYDEDGGHVLESGKPYSSKQSCGNGDGGGCHDYESITHAYHFETGRDEARDDFGQKRGLSHLVSPGYYGGYNCMGGSNPDVLARKTNGSVNDFADKGSAGWIQRCNGCHTGGGWMEKDRMGVRYDERDPATVPYLDGDYYNRGTTSGNKMATLDTISQWDWHKSGVVEADCFYCHADFSNLRKFDSQLGLDDGSDGTRTPIDHFKTLRGTYLDTDGYFRYMGTAMLEFMNLNMTADTALDKSAVTFSRHTSGDHHIHTRTKPGYTLDLGSDEQPVLNWNPAAFDEFNKITIPMLRFPGNDNCMICHRTSNSRRGFYGFGDAAFIDYSSDGTMIEDYKDDVHAGKNWTENGVTRPINDCVSCHSRNYYRADSGNTDLDANHNFLKGNSDMDVRNDLDFNPNAMSCEYCHDEAEARPVYDGYSSMQSVHLNIWKFSGDLAGYPSDSLDRITRTHLNVVSCQACHITDKVGRRGVPLQIMYRYRRGEEGTLKIIPYNPKIRYYWKDKNSGRILVQTERNAVFVQDTDDDGNIIGVITDPMTGDTYGTVSARISHGSLRFGDPDTYEEFVGLKTAYDSLLRLKGVSDPDAVMVWTESNEYVISHNTRPGVSSVQCAECHVIKSDGNISSMISISGLLGEGNVKTVTTLPDRRLVDEGIVVLDLPYMKTDDSGTVTENVSDILYISKMNPSMSALNAETASAMAMASRTMGYAEALGMAGIYDTAEVTILKSGYLTTTDLFLFKPNYGDSAIRDAAILAQKYDAPDNLSDLLFSTSRMEISIAETAVAQSADGAGMGGIVSEAYSINMFNSQGAEVTSFVGEEIVIKLPYIGTNTNPEEVRVVTSSDGSSWTALDISKVIGIQPSSEIEGAGYVLFATDHLSSYAVTDSTVAATSGDEATTTIGGGSDNGFCFIATAAYGSYEEPHVQVLRDFRDTILLTNPVGRTFADIYYTYSPPMADWIAKHNTIRAIVRVMLLPLFGFAWFLVKFSFIQQVLFLLLMTSTTAAGYGLYRKRMATV